MVNEKCSVASADEARACSGGWVPDDLDEALRLVRSPAVEYGMTPLQVWNFFQAGFVAAQVVGAFEDVMVPAVLRTDTSGA